MARNAGAASLDVVVEALALEDVEVGQRDRGRNQVPAKGVAVPENRLAVVERFNNRSLATIAPSGEVAGRQTLGARDDVGRSRSRCTRTSIRCGRMRRSPRRIPTSTSLRWSRISPARSIGGGSIRPRSAPAREHRGDGVGALELDGLGDPVGTVTPKAFRRARIRQAHGRSWYWVPRNPPGSAARTVP